MRMLRFVFFILFFFLSAQSYAVDNYQDLSLLKQQARNFLQEKIKAGPGERVEISVDELDTRLRLPACDSNKLNIFIPHNGDANTTRTLGVSCQSEQAWTVYMSTKVAIFQKIAVAIHNIPKDGLLDSSNVELVEKERSSLVTGYFTSLEALNKTVAKNMILAGQVITPHAIQKEAVVQRGDSVQIMATGSHLVVEMSGTAMSSGGVGESVLVLNPSSKRTIEARVIGAGKVGIVL